MKEITVELILKPQVDPKALVGGLARLTQVKKEFDFVNAERGGRILDAINTMGHTSLLEPLHFGFVIHGASRVFLSQVTRHRMATYVSQSQQYQTHRDFPYIRPEGLNEDQMARFEAVMGVCAALYNDFIDEGVDKDQARYAIPGAARNDLFIYMNARELSKEVFPQRLCRRNTIETRVIVSKMLREAVSHGFGDVFKHTGPACVTCGKCDQGNMACGNPYKSFQEMLDV